MALFNKKDSKKDDTTEKKTSSEKETKSSMKDLYKEDTTKTAKTSAAKKKEKVHGEAYRILVRPLVTEKAANMGEENKYAFEVSTDANKIEITKAINEVYGIKPESVNVIKMKGKVKRHGRTMGKRKDWKKAIVTLPKNKTINIYEGV